MRAWSPRDPRRQAWMRAVPLAALALALGLLAMGAFQALRPPAAPPVWHDLAAAMETLRSDPAPEACAKLTGDERLTCLLYAADRGVHVGDAAVVRAVCVAMDDASWKQSCLLDALAIDPSLSLVAYIDACETETPLYTFHCAAHARNRMELAPREVPLAPESKPSELVRVFPILVDGHSNAENVVAARAFGELLDGSGEPESECAKIPAAWAPACVEGFRL